MNLSELINEILSEWAYRVDDGMPNPKNPIHLKELDFVLSEIGLSGIKAQLIENLLLEKGKTPEEVKEAEGTFKNPALNKKINYKNAKGEDAEGIVGNLLRLPAEHPGRKAAERTLPPEGSPERDALNKDLGGQNQPQKPEKPKDKESGEEAGGGDDKAKAAQAMFDPKVDPAMAQRLSKEKEVQAKIAKDAEEAEDDTAWMSGKDGWEILDDDRAKVDNIRDYSDEEYADETGEYFENDVTQKVAPNAFKDEQDMIQKMKDAKPIFLSAEEMQNMGNTDVGDILSASEDGGKEAMAKLGKERAQEYGKDWDRIEKGIASNSAVPAPMALRDKNGQLHLLAGNTRLMSFTASGKKLPVKVIDYDGEFNTEEQPSSDTEFNPIASQDIQKEIPQADPETFGKPSDIPDGVDKEDLKKFNTDISKVQKMVDDAIAKGEKAPNINLCQITVPGTNLYCDDNLGIPREEMPQFKGKAQPGTKASDMPVDKSGEVDTEPVFREMLKQKGIKVTQTEVPADKLKATQSELVGAKVVGMMGALEENPEHEKITAPIYVSRDGFVIDGHHRWAAVAAYNAKHPDKQIPMKVQVLDQDIKDAIPMANKFAEDMGIAAKKADANKETPDEQPKQVSSLDKTGITDKIKNKIEKWTKEEKEYFEKGYYKAGSEPRRTLGEAIRDKAKGAWKAIKDGFKHEAHIFKDAGKGVGKLFSSPGGWNDLEDSEKKALKSVGVKIATTAIFAAGMGGLAAGAVGFTKLVAIEFVPHVIAETVIVGAGRAAIFADADNEAEIEANMQKFIEMIADGIENMEITPEQMEAIIDTYNKKKEKGEDNMENPQMKEELLPLVDRMIGQIIEGFIEESKPKMEDDPDVTYIPVGSKKARTIKYSSAIKYQKDHPAYIAAMKLKDTPTKKADTPTVKGADLYNDPEYQKRMGAETPPPTAKSADSEENPEGLYDPNDELQTSVVNAKTAKELFSALDELGNDEKNLMLDKVKAGAGGPVASTGETLCTEAQTNIIQGRYNPKEVRSSKEYKKELASVRNVMNGTDKRAKTALTKELDNICDKMGYYKEDGSPDYELAMAMKAEADLYIKQNLPAFKKTNVAKTKFKKEEDMVSWMKASFYSSYSLINNGPADWDRKKGNGRVMKANPRTQGAVKQVLLDGLKNAKTPEEKAHYEKQLKVWNKFKGYHDTFMVYKNDKGLTSVFHISNKKSDDLDDPQNNTTPETRLANYMAAAREANLSPKAAKSVANAQSVAMAGSADNDNIAKSAWYDIEDVNLITSLANRLPARSQTDVKDEYYTDLKKDKAIKDWYKKQYGKDKWEAKWNAAKPSEIMGVAIQIAETQDDISKLSGNFTKFLLKQGQLAQSIYAKAESGMNAKQISESFKGIYSPKEIQAILESDTMKMLADRKAQHAAGLEGVHKGFITSLHKADGTKPGHGGKNGPAVETYVAGTLKSLHIDTYVTNYDDNVQIEMGGVGCTPIDVRSCMASLSGFKGDISTPKGREALNKHLIENVKVDADSDAVYLVGNDGKTRTYLASDTWRQAGSSKKIATGFGSNLRKCLKKSVGRRLSNKRKKK